MYPSRRRSLPDIRLLVLGDLFIILLFIGAGTIHHGTTDPVDILVTTVPFVVGWFVVSSLAGAYSSPPSRRAEPFYVVGVWAGAALVGLGIRSTPLFEGGAAPSFGFVLIVGGGILFVVWRTLVARGVERLVAGVKK